MLETKLDKNTDDYTERMEIVFSKSNSRTAVRGNSVHNTTRNLKTGEH